MNINELIKWIKTMKATITINSGTEVCAYDINSKESKFQIGYEPEHEFLFRSILQYQSVSVVVREFLPLLKNEKIPTKNIYMFFGRDGFFQIISKEDVEDAMNTDCMTGKRIQPEKKVVYCQYGDKFGIV